MQDFPQELLFSDSIPATRDSIAALESVENALGLFLQNHPKANPLSDDFVKSFAGYPLEPLELQHLLRFMNAQGWHRSSILLQIERLKANKTVDWYYFQLALEKSTSQIPEDVLQSLHRGAREQGQEERLLFMNKNLESPSQHTELKSLLQHKLKRKIQKLEAELEENFLFFFSQGVLDESEKILLEMLCYFPKNEFVHQRLADLKNRKVLQQISQRPAARRTKKSISQQVDLKIHTSPQTSMSEVFLDLAKARPELRDDLVAAALMSEDFRAAKKLLESDESSKDLRQTLWLLEITLLDEKYLEALALIEILEQGADLTGDFKWQLELQYLKSLSYWGLDKKFEAIEILESIVTVNPDFRNAQALLMEWNEEVR